MLTVDRHGLPSALAERLTDEVRASFAETPREGRFKFLAQALNLDEAALLADYPTLTAEDLSNAWNYARSHREEMDLQIAANGDDA
jgi:hypothetical protein